MTQWFDSVLELGAQVEDEKSVAIGGTLFTRVPVRLLEAVCKSKPRNLEYISWGGGFPLEMLLDAGCVTSATLCFSSLDVFGQAHFFRHAIENGGLELVELSAHALHQGLWAGRRRLPFEPMVWPSGSDLVSLPGFPSRADANESLGIVEAIRPDYLLLHAQFADADGNIEILGARGLDVVAIGAAKRVLVTVDRIVERDLLGHNRHSIVIPRHFIDAIAVARGGAYPASCLPEYAADYEVLLEWAKAPSPIEAVSRFNAPTETTMTSVTVDRVRSAVARWSLDQPGKQISSGASVDEWMTVALSRLYSDDSVCSVGAVSPLATASYLLAKATHAPGMTLITNGGAYIDVASRPLLLALSEWLDMQTSIAHMGGDESYETFYQAGLVTHEVVSSAQIDHSAKTNNRFVLSPSGRSIRLPGQGGMADVADMHKNFILYLPRQSPLNTPEKVQFSTASRSILDADSRVEHGYQPGYVRLFTNLGWFEYDELLGRLVLRGHYPWTTFEELRNNTGWQIAKEEFERSQVVSDPTPNEIASLREVVDPLGVRRLEFVPSRDREPLLRELLYAEREIERQARGEEAQ